MGHAHTPVEGRSHRRRRVRAALLVTASLFVAEVIGAFFSGSLALLADATHMMTDVGALMLSYAAMTLADRPATQKHTFGLHRAEILAAFVNAEILLVISGFIFWEAWRRFADPPAIHTGLMLAVAVVGLAGNLVSLRLLHGEHRESLNVRAAYVEVLTDALASAGVIAAAIVIFVTGWTWVDAVASAVIGIVIVPRTIHLLRESAHILLEGSPGEIDLPGLREQVLRIDGVEEIHDLHVWTLTSGVHSASVHIRAADDSPRGEVLRAVQNCLRDEAGVRHATVQVEWGPSARCEMTEHEF
ncbi:MAG: cation diffusion facilitator family transporter [Candidatus Binatia bacterium]